MRVERMVDAMADGGTRVHEHTVEVEEDRVVHFTAYARHLG